MRVKFIVWNVSTAKPVSKPLRAHLALVMADAEELRTKEHHTIVPA